MSIGIKTPKQAASDAVDTILSDMCGRSGGDGWWDGIDHDIQEEIKEEWHKIVLAEIKATLPRVVEISSDKK